MCIHMLGNIVEHDDRTIGKSFLIDDDKIEGVVQYCVCTHKMVLIRKNAIRELV